MTFTDADLVRLLIWVIGGASGVIVTAMAFLGRALINKLGGLERTLQSEMRHFDQRITRVETKVGLEPMFTRPE